MKQALCIGYLSAFLCVVSLYGQQMSQHKVAAEKAQQDNLSSEALMEAVTAFAQTHTEAEITAYHDTLHKSAASHSSSLADSYLVVPLPADEEENAAQVTSPASMVQSDYFMEQIVTHVPDVIDRADTMGVGSRKSSHSSEASSLYDDAEDADIIEENNKRLSSDFSSPHAKDAPAIPGAQKQKENNSLSQEMVHFMEQFADQLTDKIIDSKKMANCVVDDQQAEVYEATLMEFAQKVFVAVATYKAQHEALGMLRFFPKLHSSTMVNRLIVIRRDLSSSIKDALSATMFNTKNVENNILVKNAGIALMQNITEVIDSALEVGYKPSFISELKARVKALSGLTKTVVLTAVVAVVGFAGKETVKRLLRRA